MIFLKIVIRPWSLPIQAFRRQGPADVDSSVFLVDFQSRQGNFSPTSAATSWLLLPHGSEPRSDVSTGTASGRTDSSPPHSVFGDNCSLGSPRPFSSPGVEDCGLGNSGRGEDARRTTLKHPARLQLPDALTPGQGMVRAKSQRGHGSRGGACAAPAFHRSALRSWFLSSARGP